MLSFGQNNLREIVVYCDSEDKNINAKSPKGYCLVRGILIANFPLIDPINILYVGMRSIVLLLIKMTKVLSYELLIKSVLLC